MANEIFAHGFRNPRDPSFSGTPDMSHVTANYQI
jgi:hypothetical protein